MLKPITEDYNVTIKKSKDKNKFKNIKTVLNDDGDYCCDIDCPNLEVIFPDPLVHYGIIYCNAFDVKLLDESEDFDDRNKLAETSHLSARVGFDKSKCDIQNYENKCPFMFEKNEIGRYCLQEFISSGEKKLPEKLNNYNRLKSCYKILKDKEIKICNECKNVIEEYIRHMDYLAEKERKDM